MPSPVPRTRYGDTGTPRRRGRAWLAGEPEASRRFAHASQGIGCCTISMTTSSRRQWSRGRYRCPWRYTSWANTFTRRGNVRGVLQGLFARPGRGKTYSSPPGNTAHTTTHRSLKIGNKGCSRLPEIENGARARIFGHSGSVWPGSNAILSRRHQS